jgi:hypothetical protein
MTQIGLYLFVGFTPKTKQRLQETGNDLMRKITTITDRLYDLMPFNIQKRGVLLFWD